MAVNPNATIRSEYKLQGSTNSTAIASLTNIKLVNAANGSSLANSTATSATLTLTPTDEVDKGAT